MFVADATTAAAAAAEEEEEDYCTGIDDILVTDLYTKFCIDYVFLICR